MKPLGVGSEIARNINWAGSGSPRPKVEANRAQSRDVWAVVRLDFAKQSQAGPAQTSRLMGHREQVGGPLCVSRCSGQSPT